MSSIPDSNARRTKTKRIPPRNGDEVQFVLSQLKKVSKTSNGWEACCPVHDDNTPSLSIKVKDDGKLLLHCHAGCEYHDVATALGIESPNGKAGRPAQSKTSGKKEKAPSTPAGKRASAEALKRLSEDEERGRRASTRMIELLQSPEDKSKPLPFPLDVFPEQLRQFIEESAESIPCPPDYIAHAVLAVVSSFIGPGRTLRIKGTWVERAVIYAATVGHTGSRKSPSMELAMLPARTLDKMLHDEGENRQHITTDVTVESLADVLPPNPRGLLVYRDEMTGWVASLNQYKGGKGADRQFWLSAWSCQDYTVNRKGKPPVRITRPYLSVIGNIPPDMLGELADRRGREDGFVDRILFSYPDPVRVRWTEKELNPALEQAYVDACLWIGELPDAELKFTDKARREFVEWYDEHNSSCDGPAGSWAKMDGYCARFVSILHHLRIGYTTPEALKRLSALDVRQERVRGAIRLVNYYKNHARRALSIMKAKKVGGTLSRLLAFIMNAPNYKVHPRNLIGAQIAPNTDEAKSMLRKLEAMGLGEVVEGERRKDEFYFQGRDDLEKRATEFEDTEE